MITKTNETNSNNQIFGSNIVSILNLECLAVLATPNRVIQFGQSVTGE